MEFEVRLFDPRAQAVREEALEAPSRAEAEARVTALGFVPLGVRVVSPTRTQSSAGRTRLAAAPLDIAWWCRELRTLLVAGMTVVEALETLNAQALGAARAAVHATLVERLRQGLALSDAMTAVGGFPAVLVAGVKAGERTSALVEALDDYLRYHLMLETMRKKVVSAAVYPLVVMSLGGAIVLFLLLYVIPRFSRMYTDLRGPVSVATRALIEISGVLNQHGVFVALVAASALTLCVVAWRAGLIARAATAASARIGPLQRRIDEFRLAKLYQSLSLLLRGGYALDEALAQCSALGLGDGLTDAVHVAKAALARGERVSKAFGDAGLTDVVTQRLLAVGERTGNFDRVLLTIAERHAENFSTFIERTTRLVEPLLLLTVALVVGGIVVMMYMPVFDIASSIR